MDIRETSVRLVTMFALCLYIGDGIASDGTSRPATKAEIKAIEKAAHASSVLKDPDSVKIRNVLFSLVEEGFFCGQFNAKNSYGAYGGYAYFFGTADKKLKYVFPSFDDAGPESDPFTIKVCRDKGIMID